MSTTLLTADVYGFSLTRFARPMIRSGGKLYPSEPGFQIDVHDKNVQLTRKQMVFLVAAFLTSENERIVKAYETQTHKS